MTNPAPVNVNGLIAGPSHSVLLHGNPKDAAGNAVTVVPGNYAWAVASGSAQIFPQGNYNVDCKVVGLTEGAVVVTATANTPNGVEVSTFNIQVVAGPFDHSAPSADASV